MVFMKNAESYRAIAFSGSHRILGSQCTTPICGLENLGMKNLIKAYRNLSVAALVEHALAKGEGTLANNGALVVETGKYTGRSPHDRFIVEEPTTKEEVNWNTDNQPIAEKYFNRLYRKAMFYAQGRSLYIFDGYVGADPKYRYGVRVVSELASHSLFAHQLFLRPTAEELVNHREDFTVIALPGFKGDPQEDGINSEAFIVLHLSKKIVLIGGTGYAGEIKKSVFSLMNYYMVKHNVLPMHCAANADFKGNSALFFGLSGTGKTSLSADLERRLIGDDEHGWSSEGIFNFEGGCYAKTINLSPVKEPQIWSAIRFGSLVENTTINADTGVINYDDSSLTENTRAAYPLEYIPNYSSSGVGNHPQTIILLTADAFGVLPPIAKLTNSQAMYYFLSGYTSKLAGTERGITTPVATFSACFGQCFFPLSPTIYAEMLGEKLRQHPGTQVYMINTGWSGGPYGVGKRIEIDQTRAMVTAVLKGYLTKINYHPHPIFKVLVPERVPGVNQEILNPEKTWSDPHHYTSAALKLADRFGKNFQKFSKVSREIMLAGPL